MFWLSLETGIIFALLSMLSFGMSDFVIAKSARDVGAFRNALWFTIFPLIMLLVLSPFFYVQSVITYGTALVIILAGVAAAAAALFYSKGMKTGNVSIVSPVSSSFVIITVVLSFVFLNEALGLLQIFYIAMIIIGIILISLNTKNIFKSSSRKVYLGVEYALLAALCWGFYFFLIGIAIQSVNWFSIYLLVNIPRLLLLVVFGYATKNRFRVDKDQAISLFSISVVILIGFLTYNIGVSYNYTDIVAPINAASAIIAVILAVIFLREKLTIIQKVGIAVGIIGLVLLSM